MNKIFLIGDIHGLFYNLKEILNKNPNDTHIVLGDVGIGFMMEQRVISKSLSYFEKTLIPSNFTANNFLFIAGNHDNINVCLKNKCFLGKYGMYNNIFFISGAYSIDKDNRTIGIDWWPNEELSQTELQKAIDFYITHKPEIVISHECPQRVNSLLHSHHKISTRTGQALDVMFEEYKPKYWFFAHHHTSWKGTVDQTEFQCLNELEVVCLNESIQKINR